MQNTRVTQNIFSNHPPLLRFLDTVPCLLQQKDLQQRQLGTPTTTGPINPSHPLGFLENRIRMPSTFLCNGKAAMSGSYSIRDKGPDPRLFSRSICKSKIDTPGLSAIFVRSGPSSFHRNFSYLYNAQVQDQWPMLSHPFLLRFQKMKAPRLFTSCAFSAFDSLRSDQHRWAMALLRSSSSPATVHRRAWI
eukprot:TRINITY_DN7672_c0_g1_i1.p1 TRINITY_DN7672_c0_g1~~TRINITY_DN7672_c0_g1_i1.p1  ORF type:complete len:191 (-),score=19.26 TRINITY_DN7672_c0_g1_i1:947-1519(-)